MPEKEYVCIVCPNSCKLTVAEHEGDVMVYGASCKRGIAHGKSEYTNPTRILTTTVAVKHGIHPRISVISDREIPKSKLAECLEELYRVELFAPISRGHVIVRDICGTGANIITSRAMKSEHVS